MAKKKSLGLYLKALGMLKSQRTASGNNANKGFKKDKEAVNEDKKVTADNYLSSPKAERKPDGVAYNNAVNNVKKKFSDPANAGNEKMVSATNPDTNTKMEAGQPMIEPNRRYTENGIISTKVTPTSEKMGFERPGVSTMVKAAAYNPDTKQLNLQYRRDNAIFPYYDVSPETVDQIINGSDPHSVGQTVLKTVFNTSHKSDQIGSLFKGMKRKGMEVNP